MEACYPGFFSLLNPFGRGYVSKNHSYCYWCFDRNAVGSFRDDEPFERGTFGNSYLLCSNVYGGTRSADFFVLWDKPDGVPGSAGNKDEDAIRRAFFSKIVLLCQCWRSRAGDVDRYAVSEPGRAIPVSIGGIFHQCCLDLYCKTHDLKYSMTRMMIMV